MNWQCLPSFGIGLDWRIQCENNQLIAHALNHSISLIDSIQFISIPIRPSCSVPVRRARRRTVRLGQRSCMRGASPEWSSREFRARSSPCPSPIRTHRAPPCVVGVKNIHFYKFINLYPSLSLSFLFSFFLSFSLCCVVVCVCYLWL